MPDAITYYNGYIISANEGNKPEDKVLPGTNGMNPKVILSVAIL